MYLFKKVSDLQHYLKNTVNAAQNLGFIPTMGALHEGHLSLLRKAKKANALTVCSIFVNPTQFNEQSDLARYPRTPGKDIELLEMVGCDVLFLPDVEEIYPPGLDTKLQIDLKGLDQAMEGAFRPGHFAGVAEVVKRLLDIVQPNQLFMGQKDFQQFTIVKQMIDQLSIPVELVMVETVREADGLAMSSRNQRLTEESRKLAPKIHETLVAARTWLDEMPVEAVKAKAMEELSASGLKPEYFEIVDRQQLQLITDWSAQDEAVACTAVWAGEVRLIDNILLSK